MRIIAGKLKGRILYFPQNKITRPLKDMARESIFNLLTHTNKITFKFEKSNILDLYAGSGSFGLECISRDAKNVYFVEKSEKAKKILEKNIRKLGVQKSTKIFFEDVFNLIKQQNVFKLKFDLIFCDPPFEDKNVEKLIKLIFDTKLLNKNGIIILHRNSKIQEKFPDFFKTIDQRIYGISKIVFGNFLR